MSIFTILLGRVTVHPRPAGGMLGGARLERDLERGSWDVGSGVRGEVRGCGCPRTVVGGVGTARGV